VRFTPVLLICLVAALGCGSPTLPTAPAEATAPPAGATAPPEGATAAPEGVEAVVERDLVVVSLGLAADRVRAGEPLLARMHVMNAGPGVVFWQGGGCDLLNGLALVGPPIDQPPAGREWPGTAGLVKWAAGVDERAHTGFVPTDLPPGVAFACTSDLRVNEIQTGATETIDAVWLGVTSDSLPAPGGRYVARVSFPFLARQAAGPFPGDPIADQRPIAVELPFEVDGVRYDGLAATEAIDAALADPGVARWIDERLPRERLGGTRIRLVDGVWRFEIDLSDTQTGESEGVAVILIEAASGRVEVVDLGP
jgi:hypothetical protein